MSATMTPRRSIVVFDLGGVLIDWDPRHLYRKLFADDGAMEHFLTEICSHEWNLAQDAGRGWDEAVAELSTRHPDHAPMIAAFRARWPEMLSGPISGTVEILRELRTRGTILYALTNWSHETFPIAEAMPEYDFLGWFVGIVVSGREQLVKPDPRIYAVLLDRYDLNPADLVYIDDNPKNAAAATALGMRGIHFATPEALRSELVGLGLL